MLTFLHSPVLATHPFPFSPLTSALHSTLNCDCNTYSIRSPTCQTTKIIPLTLLKSLQISPIRHHNKLLITILSHETMPLTSVMAASRNTHTNTLSVTKIRTRQLPNQSEDYSECIESCSQLPLHTDVWRSQQTVCFLEFQK